tara:strand:+ start:15380 stop:15994 length:615 start_codon:yes stop_codon:yes gene_type:complete
MADIARMSEIDAINLMLMTIGEYKVNDITNLAGRSDAAIAKEILHNTSRAVQSRGWTFNMDFDVVLKPDTNSEIKTKGNWLKVDTVNKVRKGDSDIVERANKLYDRQKNQFTFTEDVTVNTVTFFNFDEIPEAARRFIAIRSARIFHDRVVGSGELHRFFQEDEAQAWNDLLEYEGTTGDYTIFDSYDVYRVVERDNGSALLTT